ncbi:DNA replication/checkpoint protein [Xylariomycetidae sp. FL0641]|nr:DNA replication/checkpoint protein [Xylariomycetidae sp. FL0641]
MDDAEKQRYEASSRDLRADLKRFEADWAKQNGGKKPGNGDIKQNPEIAQKYKKYNQIRDILSGKTLPQRPKEPSKTRKRKSEENLTDTPSKRNKSAQTPSNSHYRAVDQQELETPSARKLFSPALPTSIGPTPQRDGRILGLFDLLVENAENTPSKGKNDETPSKTTKFSATPSKRNAGEVDSLKLGRTPMSESKRNRLNTFMTPSKPKSDNPLGARTPGSVSKLHLNTPSFLRRAPLPPLPEDGSYVSPPRARLPRKPLGRSLSSVVAGLRKMEEEKLDDDMEALHEMENETIASKPTKPAPPVTKPKDDILEPDSQGQQLLGGFDDEGLYDSPTEEGVGRDGQPLRVYKKKGQKRTTRRVNMKPTRAKRPQEQGGSEDEADDVVHETQVNAKATDDEPFDLGPDPETEASDEDDEDKKKKVSKKTAPKEKKEGKVQKAAKKVNELAHANFKRLKLRNSGSKGGPGFGSRFRRRR